jgi:hypothetical protein
MQNLKIKMDANLKAINEMQESFERWRVIDDYDNYSVSSFGRVRNDTTGRILKNTVNGHGYCMVGLYINGNRKVMTVHKLVANAFIDNPNNKKCVDHINNDKLNNNLTNLRYASHTENGQNRLMSKNNTSGAKGIGFNKQVKKWMANIRIDGILIHLGYFDDIEDAKKARIDRANQAFGIYINACEKQ